MVFSRPCNLQRHLNDRHGELVNQERQAFKLPPIGRSPVVASDYHSDDDEPSDGGSFHLEQEEIRNAS